MQGESAAYAHLGTFVRRAPAAQQAAFWKKVGQTISQTLAARGDAPTWVSTDRPWLGLGFGSSLVRPNQPHPHLTPTLAALTPPSPSPPLALTPHQVSTEGSGVSWVHVRLDAEPKYYHHSPYRPFAALAAARRREQREESAAGAQRRRRGSARAD